MPKKKRKETASDQAERFRKEAQKLIDAGELSPTAAEKAMGQFWETQQKQAESDT